MLTNRDKHDQRELKALRLIAKDMEQDVVDFDGSPFNGKTMGVAVGRLASAIYALAKIMEEHIDLQVKAETWDEGFEVGAEAGGRWMENGGPDDDDVNPYRGPQPEPPEIIPGTRAALDRLTIRDQS